MICAIFSSCQALREELLLDDLRDLQLLLDPLSLPGFGLLLPDQLADAHGRGRVARQGVEQAEVVGGVAAFGPPRSEAEQAHQAARGDERDHQDHTGLLERLQRRRLELEARDVHRAGRAEQIADQRVVRGQVEFGPGRHDAWRVRVGDRDGALRAAAQPAADAAGLDVAGLAAGHDTPAGLVTGAGLRAVLARVSLGHRGRPPRRCLGLASRRSGPTPHLLRHVTLRFAASFATHPQPR